MDHRCRSLRTARQQAPSDELRNCAPWLDEESPCFRICASSCAWAKIAFTASLRISFVPAGSKAVPDTPQPWRGILVSRRRYTHCQLSSFFAKHQHRQTHAPHVPGPLPACAFIGETPSAGSYKSHFETIIMDRLPKQIWKEILPADKEVVPVPQAQAG